MKKEIKKFVRVAEKIIKIIEKEINENVTLDDLFIENLNYRRKVDYIILETEIIKYYKLKENIRLFDLILLKKHKNDIKVVDLVELVCEMLPWQEKHMKD